MENLVITNAGKALIAKTLTEEITISFTKLKTSSHTYSADEIEALTILEDIKQETLVSKLQKLNASTIEVYASLNNSSLLTGYYVRAVGLYAKESTEDAEDILYAVAIDTEHPDYMPAFENKTSTGISYRLNIKVDNAEKVNLEVNPSAIPTLSQVEELQNNIIEINSNISTFKTTYMLKSEFATEETGVVKKSQTAVTAENATNATSANNALQLGGQAPTYYASLNLQGIVIYQHNSSNGNLTGTGVNIKFKCQRAGTVSTMNVNGQSYNVKQGAENDVELVQNVWYMAVLDNEARTINFKLQARGGGLKDVIVVNSSGKPSRPQNNTIWIKNTARTGKVFIDDRVRNTRPNGSELQDGDIVVYVKDLGIQNNVIINTAKNRYPIVTIKQKIKAKFVGVEWEAYYDDAWHEGGFILNNQSLSLSSPNVEVSHYGDRNPPRFQIDGSNNISMGVTNYTTETTSYISASCSYGVYFTGYDLSFYEFAKIDNWNIQGSASNRVGQFSVNYLSTNGTIYIDGQSALSISASGSTGSRSSTANETLSLNWNKIPTTSDRSGKFGFYISSSSSASSGGNYNNTLQIGASSTMGKVRLV